MYVKTLQNEMDENKMDRQNEMDEQNEMDGQNEMDD